MTIFAPDPIPPAELTPKQAQAWLRGFRDGQITGPESADVITPYDVDEEAELYEAWASGMDAADDARA